MKARSGRRGVASVIGTMLFVVVLMAGLGAYAYVTSLQTQSSQAAQQAQQLLNQKGKESLAFQALKSGTLAVANTGAVGSTIEYLLLKFANGSVYQFTPNQAVPSGSLISVPSLIPSQSCGLSSCLSKYDAILASTNPGDSVGVVTSLGNVFWEKPALAVEGANPGTTVQMTFTASGDSAFASSPVLVVDGTSYTQGQLPATLTWFVGTQHSFAWQSLAQGTGTRVSAVVTGSAQSQSGTVTAASTGSIAATFTTQYLLTITGGSGVTVSPASPTGDGYYPAGTGVQVTVPDVWSVVAGQSRSNLVSYSLDGGSPTGVTRADSGSFVDSLTMNSPHTLVLNSVTQYYVTVGSNVPASGSTGTLTLSYNYVGASTNPQAAVNPTFSNGVLNPWTQATSCTECSGYCSGAAQVTPYTGDAYLQTAAVCGSTPGYQATATAEVQQTLQNPPSGVTFTSMTFSMYVNAYNVYASGTVAYAAVCAWITDGTSGTTVCTSSSGTITATWTGSSTSVPTIFIESVSDAMYWNGNDGIAFSYAYVSGASWSITYTGPISGSTVSSSNTFTVSGGTVNYQYGVGYNYPSGSTSMSWSAPWPGTESYSSNNCNGVTSTANPIAASPSVTSAACTLSTTNSGSYPITLVSPTGDGWFDSGVAVSLSTAPSGPFAFLSWSASSSSLAIGSAVLASTTVTVSTYGTITANYSVGQ